MSGEGPDGRQQEIRLTPPPRVEPVGGKVRRGRPDPAAASRPAPAIAPPIRPGRPRWVAPLAFGLLALIAALAVYLTWAGAGASPGDDHVGQGLAPSRPTAGDDAVGEGLAPSRPTAGDDAVGQGLAPSRSTAGDDAVGEGLAPSRSVPDRATARPAASNRARTSPAPTATGEEPFGRAMAAGLTAIDAGDLAGAREAFARAAAIDPDSPEPAAGLARVEAAAAGLAIEELRARAAGLLAAEDWREAAAAYRAALEIEPSLTFAREGLEVAESRGALSGRLADHLERPERLAAPEVLSEVDRLLETARAVDGVGPRHAAQVAALEELVRRARRPVRVALVSDGRTEVTVHQVGRLGTFERRELELRPGTYVVVGSRAGYRDVRRQLEVEPGETVEPFEIRCEEKI